MRRIPQKVLNQGWKAFVHVEGWNKGSRFLYLKTENGVHYLQTEKTKQIYKTKNNLMYTKRYSNG